jgi:cytochrome c-type biogenesis protein CcmF
VVTLIVLLVWPGGPSSRPFALTMFALAAFVLATVAQELWRGVAARRATTHEVIPVALVSLIRRNRRRYGGYIVHAGLAVMLVGVAASSSFQHSQDVVLSPGHSASVDGYTIRYVRPTESVSPQKIAFGAVLNVSKGGRHVTTVTTSRNFYPSTDATTGIVGRFFAGNSDSDVGLDAGLRRDIWTVISVDLSPLQSVINQGDKVFAAYAPQVMTKAAKLPPGQAQQAMNTLWTERDLAVAEIARRFVTHPWPTEFLLIVDPLVTWIWLGALIIGTGGLIALWPVPTLARRRAAVPKAARPSAPPPVPVREPV